MRNAMKATLYGVVSLILFYTLHGVFQKYGSTLTILLVFWLLDFYLWVQSSERINSMPLGPALLVRLLYWLPYTLILFGVIYGYFYPFIKWNPILRTEVFNIILIGYAVKLPPIVARLLTDAGRLIRPLPARSRPYGEKWKPGISWLMITGWSLGCILGLALLAGHLIWRDDYRERMETIELKELPASFNGLRIVQISDLHLGSWERRGTLQKAITSVNSLNPDLIFVTGDLANFSTLDILRYQDLLKELHARRGIFAVYGNHDYCDYYKLPSTEWMGLMERSQNLFETLGWHLLLNQHYVLANGTDSLAILGVENWGLAQRFQKLANLDAAEKRTEHMPVKLLLSHDPTYWEEIVTKRYPEIDVTFSGHTHGGQIGLELPRLRFSLVSEFEKCWAGWYVHLRTDGKKQLLYVNRGLGTVGYDGRIGILPEITVFTLRKGP